jgi:hypothetical protein
MNGRSLLQTYLKEISRLKLYIVIISAVLLASYSVYFFLDINTVSKLGMEDNLFEWVTALSFLAASFICLMAFLSARNFWFFILFILFFTGFGEEISWAQRIINFKTPASIAAVNVQEEVTIHNLVLFNRSDFAGNVKHGLSRLLEINFLFKLFTVIYGIIVPLAVYYLTYFSKLAKTIRLPIPPLSLGIFFLVNWLSFRLILQLFLPLGVIFQYYDTDTEIFECISAFILLVISIYFYNERKRFEITGS